MINYTIFNMTTAELGAVDAKLFSLRYQMDVITSSFMPKLVTVYYGVWKCL